MRQLRIYSRRASLQSHARRLLRSSCPISRYSSIISSSSRLSARIKYARKPRLDVVSRAHGRASSSSSGSPYRSRLSWRRAGTLRPVPLLAPSSHRRLKFCSFDTAVSVSDLFSTNFLCELSERVGSILAPQALTCLARARSLALRGLWRGLRRGLRWPAYRAGLPGG